jgi:hypothetical protein
MSRLAPLLAAAALAAQGCIIVTNDTGNPDMRLNLSFDGLGCAAARVGAVRLTFVSPNIGSPLTATCLDPMFVTIPDLAPGTYTIRVEAFSAVDPGFVEQAATFDVLHTMAGTHEYALDLTATTEVLASFTFAGVDPAPGMTCAEAGVATVEYVVDDRAAVRKPCTTNGRDAAVLDGVTPGVHDFLVTGLDPDGRALYASQFRAVPINRGTNDLKLNLLAAVGSSGGVELNWFFGTPQSRLGCEAAGVAYVQLVLGGPTGQTVPLPAGVGSGLDPNGGQYLCADGRVRREGLAPGVYSIRSMVGYSGGISPVPLYELANARVYVPAGKVQGFDVTLPPRL